VRGLISRRQDCGHRQTWDAISRTFTSLLVNVGLSPATPNVARAQNTLLKFCAFISPFSREDVTRGSIPQVTSAKLSGAF
jgi:hypothetical protein